MAVIKNDNWIRKFEVTDPKKHKNGFTVYKVTSVVFPRSAPEASTSVVVWKRYNDFKKLYKKLQSYHKQCKISEELPQLCKEKYFKRFEENVIKDRMNFALELLNFIGRHQTLFTSDPFLQFFNNGYHIAETNPVVGDTLEVCLNGNNLDLSSDMITDDKRNCLVSGLWDSRSSNESISVPYDCSDEDITITSDTSDSVSPIHSIDSMLTSKENLHSVNIYSSNSLDPALDIAESPKLLTDEIINLKIQQQSTLETDLSNEDREIVTCHSEKPIEISLSVRTEDFRSVSDSMLPANLNDESWITPPGTPSGRQDYLVEAAYHVGQAQKYEVDGQFEAAFCFYKAAIACLLSGVQDDQDKQRRQAVKEKTNQYLQRAEKIYALHLAPERGIAPKKMTESMEEIKTYKVLGIIDSSVMLVLNTLDEKFYVIKVLQKSPCPVDIQKKTTIPYNVPYMVKLYKYFENENSIFLVLDYASGRKLWDNLHNFDRKRNTEENDFYSCSSSSFQDELIEVFTKDSGDAKVNSQRNVPFITLEPPENVVGLTQSDDIPKKNESVPVTGDSKVDLEVTCLLENSQKLLNSVSKTLRNSEKITDNLNKELNDIETVFDLKYRMMAANKIGVKFFDGNKKRSRSAGLRPIFERSFSTEDLSDSRSRTASSSIDRRSEWTKVDSSFFRIPESVVRGWAAELLVALENLHRWGIICKDLHPGNILLSDEDHIILTFQGCWKGVDSLISEESISGLYAAPEILSVFPITPAADWWSFGALLHHLLTGKALSVCYPEGIFGHTILTFPDYLSPEACSLLRELLKFEPSERFGSGVDGAEEIKCHPFFKSVDWQMVYNNC